jgi:hypothetical protein
MTGHASFTNRYADKRRTSRVRVHLQARYVSSTLNLDGMVTDLSPDGLFFCSDYLDDRGEFARVWIEIPSRAAPLELRGEVRWVNEGPDNCGMGIKFDDVPLEDRILLSALRDGGAEPLEAQPPSGSA